MRSVSKGFLKVSGGLKVGPPERNEKPPRTFCPCVLWLFFAPVLTMKAVLVLSGVFSLAAADVTLMNFDNPDAYPWEV